MVRPLGARGRWRVMGGALVLAVAALATSLLPDRGVAGVARNVAPALFILGAYRLAGGYFVEPQPHHRATAPVEINRRLLSPLRLEARLTAGSSWGLEVLEAAYFSVYALLPLGAWATWRAGRFRERGRLLDDRVPLGGVVLHRAGLDPDAPAESPRAVGRVAPGPVDVPAGQRRLVLARGSHHMNTIPSGHAAGAVAVALALWSLQAPTPGPRRRLGEHRLDDPPPRCRSTPMASGCSRKRPRRSARTLRRGGRGHGRAGPGVDLDATQPLPRLRGSSPAPRGAPDGSSPTSRRDRPARRPRRHHPRDDRRPEVDGLNLPAAGCVPSQERPGRSPGRRGRQSW